MYVCLCGGVTDSQIKEQVELGAVSVADLQKTLPIGLCCGTCNVVTEQFILLSLNQLVLLTVRVIRNNLTPSPLFYLTLLLLVLTTMLGTTIS
mgnify:CR=1 FL=1